MMMTWGRALPVLVVAVVFDLVRMFFEMFWVFGPALAAAYCGAQVADVAVVGKLLAAGCVAGAGAVGYFTAPALTTFGIIMAMTVGLFGWATVTLVLAVTNPRIWKSNVWSWIWSISALGVAEMPLLGTIPMLTIAHLRLYAGQIKGDRAALKRYRQEQEQVARAAATARSMREQAQLMQNQADQLVATDVY